MRGIWFEEHERQWNEQDSEPDPQSVHEAVTERLSVMADRARERAKYGEE